MLSKEVVSHIFLGLLVIFVLFLATLEPVYADPILEQTTTITSTVQGNSDDDGGDNGGSSGGGGGSSGGGYFSQCSDHKDNDLNGFCDYKGCYINNVWYYPDEGCHSYNDNIEYVNITGIIEPVVESQIEEEVLEEPEEMEEIIEEVEEPKEEEMLILEPIPKEEKELEKEKIDYLRIILLCILGIEIIFLFLPNKKLPYNH